MGNSYMHFSIRDAEYPEPPSIEDVQRNWRALTEDDDEPINSMYGELANKENYEKAMNKIQQSMKPKEVHCPVCGKMMQQEWDSVTGQYYTIQFNLNNCNICGSCASRALNWLYKVKAEKKNGYNIEQEEVEVKLPNNKTVDKSSLKCDNCLYKIRNCKLKCNTCKDFSNFKENYAR